MHSQPPTFFRRGLRSEEGTPCRNELTNAFSTGSRSTCCLSPAPWCSSGSGYGLALGNAQQRASITTSPKPVTLGLHVNIFTVLCALFGQSAEREGTSTCRNEATSAYPPGLRLTCW